MITSHALRPIYPALCLVDGRPTVNGVSYDTYAEALQAKESGVRYVRLDVFGAEERVERPELHD